MVLHAGEPVVLVRGTIDGPVPFRAARPSANLARSVVLRDGWLVVSFTASGAGLSRYTAEPEAAGVDYRVRSVTPSAGPANLPTDRQRGVVAEAVERGTTGRPLLAHRTGGRTGVTKGSLSRVVRRAEGAPVRRSSPGRGGRCS